ncbi:MAG: tRNA threonylcarbamoyladenosine dehydratase [Paludibacteraceae bacterium]|nr:tRNA threonylcarbamoyladenosine dehydratase [Paludibacteraceae bacterium]
MEDYFSRSEALLGPEAMEALRNKRVLIVGVGGVGSWCAEALVRTGLMHLTIMDGDVIQASNVNRQLPALRETIGQPKVLVLCERLKTINPEAEIRAVYDFYEKDGKTDSETDLHLETYDYIIDAIDSVAAKTDLILCASRVRGCKVFSSMGAALRFNPTQVRVAELMDVKGDALAKAVRARMKKMGVRPNKKVKCVYSLEQAQRCEERGSLMQVTAVFGCTLASLVVEEMRKKSLNSSFL